jgi:molecular chaperone DnaJ
MARDYYGILGVSPQATPDEIKKAYRKLARELHPDVNASEDAHEKFTAVQAAYDVLSDPQKRQIVDLGGDPLSNGGPGGGAQGAGPFGGFSDIMDAFFGAAQGAQRGPRSRSRAGADALVRIDLDLADAAFGTTREITLDTAGLG